MTNQVEKLFSSKFFFPLLLIFVAILAFGMFVQQQGFYWDDWPVVMMAKQADSTFLQEFYSYDRPFSFWTYQLTLPVLGTSPQAWQVFSLLARTLCAWLVWQVVLSLWPNQKFTAAGTSLLFLVYPSFTQQSISVAYSQHFISLSLFFFSLFAMLRSLKNRRPVAWIVAAITAQVLHLGTLEYFAGLELLRPLTLYFYWRERGKKNATARRQALGSWTPYAIVLLVFVLWRVFFLNLPEDPNTPQLLANLSTDFFITMLGFVERSLQDFVQIFFGPWGNTFYSELIDFSNSSRVLSIGLALSVGWITTLYLRRVAKKSKRDVEGGIWGGQAVMLGIAAVFLGMLPVRIADRDLLTGLFSDRFTLPALFGAALLWVGLARVTVRRALHRALLIGVLVGISAGFHFRTANTYGWDWETQQRIYWQMHWRMPNLPEGVALVGNGSLSAFTSEYAAAAAINTLYRKPITTGLTPLWVLDFYDDFQVLNEGIEAKTSIHQLRNMYFEVDEEKIILFDYSTPGQCLWILDDSDTRNLDVEPEMRDIASASRVELVIADEGHAPYRDVFGQQPELDWCFFFQKIELAAQLGDWRTANVLWLEAAALGFAPNNQYEMLSVIEALARTGDVEEAVQLSLDAIRKQLNVKEAVCSLWEELQDLDATPLAELVC